ncbi:archaeosortase A [Halosegnis marinus]|uniref:Archaeosortase A n=1 Tax=Halosegnis marinus TaxID=3034023 RepID=A0ABD5ZRR9_9EURY|nr:archaeosortase A [Halosegnis sp. DT85]
MATSLLTTVLAWVVVVAFAGGVLLPRYDARAGRLVTAGAWVVFGVFWGTLVPHFWFAKASFIEAGLSVVAVPACAYTGYLLYRGRDSLFVLSRAVAVMGVIYLPATTLDPLFEPLIELVAVQAQWGIELLGYDPVIVGNGEGVDSVILFNPGTDAARSTEILLACTGLGSIAILAGLILAVDASRERKAKALLVSVPTIWVLNIVRNVFIAAAFGAQWFQVFVPQVIGVFGATGSSPELASYYIADKVLAQSASVVALVAILLAVLRYVPELKAVVADVLYLVTGTEYDLGGGDPPQGGALADGGKNEE